MATKNLTLDTYLAKIGIEVKDWQHTIIKERHIGRFVTDRKAYTLLPEYFARCFAASGSSVKDIVWLCNDIAENFNLDGKRFLQSVLSKTVELVKQSN